MIVYEGILIVKKRLYLDFDNCLYFEGYENSSIDAGI